MSFVDLLEMSSDLMKDDR